MAVRIVLFDPPDYYTNLDTIRGEVRFRLTRPENIGTVVVKLEGESSTSLTVPTSEDDKGWTFKTEPLSELDTSKTSGATTRPAPGTVFDESHKVLYQVTQVYPRGNEDLPGNGWLPAAEYVFPFQFQFPINNACADPVQLVRSGGVVDSAGNLESPSAKLIRFGASSTGIRIMDGSKQLQYKHVKQTLPPSFDGFLSSTESTEIRYFIKATVQRPGIFKGNWRNSYGFRFLPIEPLREPPSAREVFARRPFAFRQRSEQTEAPPLIVPKKKSTFFRANSGSALSLPDGQAGPLISPASAAPAPALQRQVTLNATTCKDGLAPSVLLTAFLPYKPILTCNEAIPLRITAQKMEPSREQVLLTSLEIRLTGTTRVRSQDLEQTKLTKWVVASSPSLSIPVSEPDAPVGSEIIIPNYIWCDKVLPDTVMPSFMTCNVSRSYQLETRAGLSWNTNAPDDPLSSVLDATTRGKVQSKKEQKATQKAIKSAKAMPAHLLPQTIILPLVFESVDVYSGIKLNPALVEVAHRHRQRMSMLQQPSQQQQWHSHNHNYNIPQSQPQPQLLDSHPIPQNRPYPPHVNTRGPPPGMPRPYHQPMNHYPSQHPTQQQQRQMSPRHMPGQRASPHRPQQEPEPQIFELPSEPVPALPPRPGSSANASPMTPSGPSFPHVPHVSPVAPVAPTTPITPEALEMPANPVIRRRPVPPQFAQQQREEQHRRENSERFPSGECSSSGLNLGQVHGSVHRHGPRQQYHMYQQQTMVSPLYPPRLQPGEDPASLAQPRQAPLSSSSSDVPVGASPGTVLVSYNGVVSTMVQDVASAIDAFSFADGDTASIYQEPPPSYDEAIAETITAVAEEGDYRAQRPTFNV